jgi:predicted aspartyl protease
VVTRLDRPTRLSPTLQLALALFMAAVVQPERPLASETCVLKQLASLPVTITGKRKIIVPATLNGTTVRAFVDTGSAATMLLKPVADELHLPLQTLRGKRPYGAGGELAGDKAFVRSLELGQFISNNANIVAVPEIDGGKRTYDMVLGGDLLSQVDVDIDLSEGRVRLFERNHCNGNVVYWADTAMSYSFHLSEIKRIELKAKLNGEEVWASLDTGAATTLLSWQAAERIGLTPESPRLEPAGRVIGFDGRKIQSWGTRIDSVAIGGETMQNYPIVIANTKRSLGAPTGSNISEVVYSANVLIGTEFFQVNHVFIAYGEQKIYYTPYTPEQRKAAIERIGATEKAFASSTAGALRPRSG